MQTIRPDAAPRRALLALVGALMLAALTAGAHAELKPINPFAATSRAAFGLRRARRAPSRRAARGGVRLGARTQQSLQRELATGVKGLKADTSWPEAGDARVRELHLSASCTRMGRGTARPSFHLMWSPTSRRCGAGDHLLHCRGTPGAHGRRSRRRPRFRAQATGLQINAWSNRLESLSYAMIALVGACLLITQLIRLYRGWQVGA